jgi:hypothetical protein
LQIANILTSIHVFSIIIRYNILQIQGVKVPVWLANLFAVVAPWVVALPFFPGNLMGSIITWSSAILFVLVRHAARKRRERCARTLPATTSDTSPPPSTPPPPAR